MGESEKIIREADQIIFESTPGLFLFEKVKRLNKKAKIVYRVSDDLKLLGVHPSLLGYEKNILKQFDLVSVASSYVLNKLKSNNKVSNIKLHYHGLNKEIFKNKKLKSPYEVGKTNALFIGVANLDYEFIRIASELRKDIIFHIIGPLKKEVLAKNIMYYGEIPFNETIKFIKYADIALHTIIYFEGAESLSESSLKSIQYSYCNLPIIAPSFLKNNNKKLFIYNDYDDINNVLKEAKEASIHGKIMKTLEIYSWDELTEVLDEN